MDGILLPPISLLPIFNRNLEEKFAVLRYGEGKGRHGKGGGYNTPKLAMEDGAVVMAYGYVSVWLYSFLPSSVTGFLGSGVLDI